MNLVDYLKTKYSIIKSYSSSKTK